MLIALLAFVTLATSIVFFVLGLTSSAKPKTDRRPNVESQSCSTASPYSTAPPSIHVRSSSQNTTPSTDTRYEELLRDCFSLLQNHRALLDDREALRNELRKTKVDEVNMIEKINTKNSNESRGMQTEFVHVRSRTPMPDSMNTPGARSFVLSPIGSFFDRFSAVNSPTNPSPRDEIPMQISADPRDPRPLNDSACIPLLFDLSDSGFPTDWWRMFDTDSLRVLLNYSAEELLLLWTSELERMSKIIERLAVDRAVAVTAMDDLKVNSDRRDFKLYDKMQEVKALIKGPSKSDETPSAPSSERRETSAPDSERSETSINSSDYSYTTSPDRSELSDDESNWIKIH